MGEGAVQNGLVNSLQGVGHPGAYDTGFRVPVFCPCLKYYRFRAAQFSAPRFRATQFRAPQFRAMFSKFRLNEQESGEPRTQESAADKG